MLFAIHWTFSPEVRNEANSRFSDTGGGPPEGVRMLGRWHRVDGGGGVCIAETDEAEKLGIWMQEWTDLLEFEIDPVVDDAGVSTILAAGGD